MLSRTFSLMVSVLVFVQPAQAQTDQLTVERIWGSPEFNSSLKAIQWLDDVTYTTTERHGEHVDLYRVEVETENRELIVRGEDLIPSGAQEPIRIEKYEFSNDRSKLLIFTNSIRVWRQNTKGEYYVWDFEQERLLPTTRQEGYQSFAKLSPDNRLVGFVRDNNIFVTNLATGEETQVTSDGSDDIINGTSDWVYEEELGLRDAFRFSPDGSRIAFWRLDQSAIRPFALIDELELYPELNDVRYPKAGEQNSTVQIGIAVIGSGDVAWADLGEDNDVYVARMDFMPSGDAVWLTRLNRHQNQLDLMVVDAESGSSEVVMTDRDEAWVEVHTPVWLDDGRFLFLSERGGYAQIYLFDDRGEVVRNLTPDAWDVQTIHGVDSPEEWVYFSGNGEGPLERHVYRVAVAGGAVEKLTSAPGTHAANFSAGLARFVDTYSRAYEPPRQSLHNADGSLVTVVSDNQALRDKVAGLALRAPEFFTVPGADGTELNAYLVKPADFDSTQNYPLVMYVYGGPGSQTVTDGWGGARYLWHQLLAERGILVASVDNRGTGARGRDFKKITYQQLGVHESDDQIAAARFFGSLPYIDADRIGIWGWSYGGYMSSLSMLRGGGAFSAALVVAPVTDWRLYDTIYTERFMRTPQENAEGYRVGAPVTYADQLEGDFLLVHGTGDDNVHSQNSTRLVEALIQANKQFDMRYYPNRTHSIAGGITRVNLYGMFTMWLEEHLGVGNAQAVLP